MLITTAKERPILFSGPMVRAILDGTKTQTRRIVKPQPTWMHESMQAEWFFTRCVGRDGEEYPGAEVFGVSDESHHIACQYGSPGDRLWVRETWVELLHTSPATDEPLLCDGDKLLEHATQYRNASGDLRWHYNGRVIAYRATSDVEFCDGDGFSGDDANKDDMPRWKPSIHMRREYSRIDLEITSVRVERLQEITEEDAEAEGFDDAWLVKHHVPPPRVISFRHVWEDINGAASWSANPWVWVVTFKRVDQE